MRGRGLAPALGALLAILAPACDGGGTSGPTPSTPAPTGPYVVTAIDYHFHDAHPSDPIAPSRQVAFVNVGRNVHNVTFEHAGYDRDLEPGDRLVIDVDELLGGPGEYVFGCSYHLDRGMTGVLVIV